MVVTEGFLGVGVDTAAVGVAVHEVVEVKRQDKHNESAEGQAQHGSDRSRERKESGSRHYKGSPADTAAKGERPRTQYSKILLTFCVSLRHTS